MEQECFGKPLRKTFVEKLADHLEAHEEDCDVIFEVGAQNEIIKTSRLILAVSSETFKKIFREQEDQQPLGGLVNRDMNQNFERKKTTISLPDADPSALRIFLKVLLWDDTSVDKLSSLELSLTNIFDVIELCKKYDMIELQTDFELLLRKFVKNLARFIHTPEFLTLPEYVLEGILRMNFLPLDEITLFAYVCKWAEVQCQKLDVEINGENIRKALGNCFSLIRFPVISTQDFRSRVSPKNILTVEEELALFKYITLSDQEKELVSSTKDSSKVVLDFNGTKRSELVSIPLKVADHFDVVDEPPFVCNSLSELHSNYFRISSRIAIVSLGFLGPIKEDSWYTVDVEIKSYPNAASACLGKLSKKVYGRKQAVFRVEFDSPVILEANNYCQMAEGDTLASESESNERSNLESWYEIEFSLTGANTQSMVFSQDVTRTLPLQTQCSFKIRSKGVEFDCLWESCQLAEIRYEKL